MPVYLNTPPSCPDSRGHAHDWACESIAHYHEDGWLDWIFPCDRDTCPGHVDQRFGIHNWIKPCNDGKKNECPGWSLAGHKYDTIKGEWLYTCRRCGVTKIHVQYHDNFTNTTQYSNFERFNSLEYYVPTPKQHAGTLDFYAEVT